MPRFELLEPRSLNEACSVLSGDTEAKPIAGGTALLTIVRQGLLAPKTLVNLKKIRDGSDISFERERGLRIGALATIHEIETSPLVREHYPILAKACHVVANIRIRHMATIGGNLAHADFQSDPPTALAVLNATIEITSAQGTRSIKIDRFQLGAYETALEPGELITAILIPRLPEGCKGTYLKFTTGSSEERPCAGIAALGRFEHHTCRELRIAVGAVSSTAVRSAGGEEMARDRPLSPELIGRIAAEAAGAVDPIEDLRGTAEYKRHLVRVLLRRALAAITNGGKERAS
jgi:aerobic carbon-monoxide dehydrogenase medium subunit